MSPTRTPRPPAKPNESTPPSQPSLPAASTPAAPPPQARVVVSRDALAELMGVHPDTISDYTRRGMPVLVKGGHGLSSEYDAVACLSWGCRVLTISAKDEAQIRQMTAVARRNETKLERELGELISRDQVVLEGIGYTRAWAAKVRALPRRLAQAGIIEGRTAIAAATAICEELLDDIHEWRVGAPGKKSDAA